MKIGNIVVISLAAVILLMVAVFVLDLRKPVSAKEYWNLQASKQICREVEPWSCLCFGETSMERMHCGAAKIHFYIIWMEPEKHPVFTLR